MKLYVKDVVREPNDTLYTFLKKVLRLDPYNTYMQGTVSLTCFDPEYKQIQCDSGKHRSFDDLVLISKTYFKVSDKAVAKVLIRLINKHNRLILVLCDSAKKWVLNTDLTKSDIFKYCAIYNKSDLKTDDCGLYGNYSFDDIITLAGLTKEDLKV